MNKPEKLRTDLPTAKEQAADLLISPEEVYRDIVHRARTEEMTLEQALGEVPSEISGREALDAAPQSVVSQIHTGIFPPSTQAELDFLRLENKNASEAELLKRMLASGSLTLADTKGYRVRTAYRLVRQMAFVRGLLDDHDMLQVILNMSPDEHQVSLWQMPVPLVESRFMTGNRGIRAILRAIDEHSDSYLFNTARGLYRLSGSTTLPPPIPDRFYPSSPSENWRMRVSRKVPEGYDVKQDRPLILYCEAMTMTAEQLGVKDGAPEEPWAGHFGLAGLLNPHTARIAWPTRDELVMYEEELMLKIWDKACHTSIRATEEWMQKFFGYTRLEALDIVKAAVSVGSILYNEGTEEMRALEIKRLDSLEDTCDRADDPRAKLAVKRLKFQALGLTQNDEQDSVKDIRDAAIAGIQSVHERIEDEPKGA